MNGHWLIETQGLGKSFGDTEALAGIDLTLRAGEIVGLLGPNGAGKTTTLKLLLGMLRPTAGKASVLGIDCSQSLNIKRHVGYSPDEPAFYDFLTGRETIDLALSVRGTDPKRAWPELKMIAEMLQLSPQLDVFTANYSHGMKKKLALLLAFAHHPRVLLLDEPTNGLDPPAAQAVRALLLEKVKRGAGVLLSTHLLDMAERMCTRVFILHRGKVVAQGTPADVCAAAGSKTGKTLEDAFLRFVGS